jgi:D-alanyl-lipoteichoic acid acyltransferase DltB (MBOAT superfamily)
VNISLLSPSFLGIALAAIVLLTTLRGVPRQLAFLALNLAFVCVVVLPAAGAAGTLLFTLLGYALAHVAMRRDRRLLVAALVLVVTLFVYMRRYDFLAWVLPDSVLTAALSTVGLSFLFFRIVHVMIDGYSGTLGRLEFLTYVNYCLAFTTFLMGPIQRYQDFRDQWEGTTLAIPLEWEAHLDAGLRVLVGLVKAYVLAPFVQERSLQPDTNLLELTTTGFVVQSYAFWVYLYLNFSGYCDVVIGVGSLFGVRPPENFNKPFLARNISDFWLRQHRSLTLWLSDYVFTPLYKTLLTRPWTARHKLLAANVSLMATMMVSGLWHGTTFSFFLFGLVHGLWFVIYRTWDELLVRRLGRKGAQRFRARPVVQGAGIFLTFNATAFTFVFFQVSSDRVAQALSQLLWR